ncbi:RNA polymerase-associated protein rtf1 [Coemansia aciculifera]|uniref:RNA polymerase-associated protein rtf1 n=1 Tax=Coemansia aciculifera TaxID=417176 RepID=A0ACC1M334_9FUNG|nr:RNA polymerase-associated protein rtf1 [Coemansia aciculifera]KAJ2909637.1 RNA polymerase-associated protein rtf1 [Coemansia aciculifera]
MSNLDKDILEKDILDLFDSDRDAGRSSERNHRESRSKSHHNSKRSRHGRYSRSPHRRSRRDDYSASENNGSEDMDTADDDEEIIDIGDEQAYSAPSNAIDSEDEPLDQWGEDLMGDQKDRRMLAAMNEVDRERILAERQDARDQLNEQREVRMKLKAGARVSGLDDASRATRSRRANRTSSGRAAGGSGSGAFSDLKRARERRRHGSPDNWTPSHSDDEEGGKDDRSVASLDEINTICLSRSKLEQWLLKPFFSDTIIGCFVRIVTLSRDSSGAEFSQYKMMQITDVVQGEGKDKPPYHLNKSLTDKYLTLRYGASEGDYSMETISNSLIKTEEFNNWTSALRADRVRSRVTTDAIQKKLQDMERAKNYKLSELELTQMIEERNRLRIIQHGGISVNPAHERSKLNQRRRQAVQDEDWEEIKKVDARFAELEKLTGLSAKRDGALNGLSSTTTTHKPLLAPSTSRYGSADGKGKQQPVRRNKLLSPGSNARPISLAALNASTRLADTTNRSGGGTTSFALVPEIKQQEISLRSKVTPGYTELMAANGGYDMSFITL